MKRPPPRPRTESERVKSTRPRFVRQPLDGLPDPIALATELLWCIIVPEERMPKWTGHTVFQGPIHGPAINVINVVLGFAGRSPVKSGHFYCPVKEPVTTTVGTETWTVSEWPELPLTREQLLNSWFGCRCPEKEFNLRLRSAPIRTDGGLGSWNLIPLGELLDTKTPSDRYAHELHAFSAKREPWVWEAFFHIKDAPGGVASTTAELWTRRVYGSKRAAGHKA